MAKTNGLDSTRLRQLAHLGAEARLKVLREEIRAIERAFPELATRSTAAVKGEAARPKGAPVRVSDKTPSPMPTSRRAARRRGRRQSVATRRNIAEGLKRYWAQRKTPADAVGRIPQMAQDIAISAAGTDAGHVV